MRTEKYKDGKLVEIIDDSTLEQTKLRIITMTKALCGELIDEIAPPFKQLNVAMGLYDDAKCQMIKQSVQDLRNKQQTMEDEINSLTTIDEVLSYQIIW